MSSTTMAKRFDRTAPMPTLVRAEYCENENILEQSESGLFAGLSLFSVFIQNESTCHCEADPAWFTSIRSDLIWYFAMFNAILGRVLLLVYLALGFGRSLPISAAHSCVANLTSTSVFFGCFPKNRDVSEPKRRDLGTK